ncbi:hypothetical protein [Marasmitruncus massiliensis]|uniref:hypothetical protein n=1 Tax=Marasmitruncus massiliensis TaxID=1944642 RepID=UPI0015E0FA12|nr:hypothetical protein [Marasmitruncus massiliensis]
MQIEKISQNQFAVMVEMLFTLLQKGIITRAEADKTAQRIASQNELAFIYLW